MLKFNIIELINKFTGFIITALLARILTDDFGTYLYYQTIFGYLYAFALFSSDYNFLVNYKINKEYIGSLAYYQTLVIKMILIILVLLVSIYFLTYYNDFAFWPYLIAVASSLFVYDFILYVENDKKNLILYRFLSQVATLGCVLLFYFQLLNLYYITVIQAVQTLILTLGTYKAALRHFPVVLKWEGFQQAVRSIGHIKAGESISYFLLRNFIIFFTTIEVLILAQKQMLADRDIFTEGMRLSSVLMPFALFYINFNINKIKKGFYTAITLIAVVLLLISPMCVLAFMGETFVDKIYLYNFFIWVFVFNAFLEKDYVELLTQSNNSKKQLLTYNICFFTASVLLFFVLITTSVSFLYIVLFFIVKLLLYYVLLIRKFALKLSYLGVISSCLLILLVNMGLNYSGYYSLILKYLMYVKTALG